MIKVDVFKERNYPVGTPKVKKRLREFFQKKGVVSDAQVSVALVGEKRTLELGRKYLKDKTLHNVLSFTPDDQKHFSLEKKELPLGEIVVCFPKVVAEAKVEGKLIEEKLFELVEHGALHLLGFHHQ